MLTYIHHTRKTAPGEFRWFVTAIASNSKAVPIARGKETTRDKAWRAGGNVAHRYREKQRREQERL